MNKNDFNHVVTMASIGTLIKVAVIGFTATEVWRLGLIIATKLNGGINTNDYEIRSIVISLVLLLLVIAYLYFRDVHKKIFQVLKSQRLDILLALILGGMISSTFQGYSNEIYISMLDTISLTQLITLLSIPFWLGILSGIRLWQVATTKVANNDSFFISDTEISDEQQDLLNISDNAKRFAERIFNMASSDSVVFGIDAPWGIGKSSFINLCQNYWKEHNKNQVIVYRFNPLKYENSSNLLEKFVDGLIQSIQKETFIPEIKPLISKYSKFIKTKSTFKLPGLDIELLPNSRTADDAFEDLEYSLGRMDKKIIIIVDDLDRLSFNAIKEVLFVIKKSFSLPNVSYVICYDTHNISALEKDNIDPEKVTEFLEKFVNVKVSLYHDNETLSNYISKNLEKLLSGNSQADPVLVSQAVGGLLDIYNSNDYHNYLTLVGDVRKLKRLLNTILMLEVEQVDFENSDFNKKDLIHLLLIYINYPSTFRKIYNTETRGKSGFFSLVIPYDDHYPKIEGQGQRDRENQFKNSTLYTDFLKTCDHTEKFLLNQVFQADKILENTEIDQVPEEIKHTYACFNGAWTGAKNLEAYLDLIVKLSKPQKSEQYNFYLKKKNQIQDGESIGSILKEDEFKITESESSHLQLWRVIINSLHDFKAESGRDLIRHLISNMDRYSLLNIKEIGLGLRDDLDYHLVKLLNTVGWSDENDGHSENTEENIVEITQWIFGNEPHQNEGILKTVGNPERGVVGLYDLMIFRLFCCSNRGGDIFNLERALMNHSGITKDDPGYEGRDTIKEMRKMTQEVFAMFKSQYIDTPLNFYAEIDKIETKDLTGDWQGYLQSKIDDGTISLEEVDKLVAEFKNRMKAFITYQLGTLDLSHGVGCGYYDETGTEDKQGIKTTFNDYLFGYCFNPDIEQINYEHFIDYLMISFASVFVGGKHGRGYVPHINEFTKALDKDKLASYWETHSEAVKALNLHQKDKTIRSVNYTATYSEDLEDIFVVLDTLVAPVENEVIAVQVVEPAEELA